MELNAVEVKAKALELVKRAGVRRGWALVADAGPCQLTWHLAAESDFNIVALVHDAKQREAARRMFDEAGLLGSRVSVEPWTLEELPDYFANLIVSEGLAAKLPAKELARVLRPAGGKLILSVPDDGKFVEELKKNARAETSTVITHDSDAPDANRGQLEFTRGKLNGAGEWTGLYGNMANTSSSRDELVKGPLGVLWFGEPGSENMVERHARAASPLAINGRLIMQGAEMVMAHDAYNGAFLWKREIKGAVRVRVDVDGSNLAATDDAIFVATGDHVHHLDAQTGNTIRKYTLPRKESDPALRWGYIAVQDGILFGSSAVPLKQEYGYLWNVLVKDGEWKDAKDVPANARGTLNSVIKKYPKPDDHAYDHFKREGLHWRYMAKFPNWLPDHNPSPVNPETIMLSSKLFAFDTKTGKLLWERKGKDIPNISLVLGEGRLFFLEDDLMPAEREQVAEETKSNIHAKTYEPDRERDLLKTKPDYRRVVCLEARSGQPVWSRAYDLSGSGGTKLGLAYQKGRDKRGRVLAFGHYSNHDERPFNDKKKHEKGGLHWRRITVIDGGNLHKLITNASGVVLINSTTGIEVLQRGIPLKVLGIAVFDIAGLAHQGPLDDFWINPPSPDGDLTKAFIKLLVASVQVKGNFFTRAGRRVATREITRRLLADDVNSYGAFVTPPPRLEEAKKMGVPMIYEDLEY